MHEAGRAGIETPGGLMRDQHCGLPVEFARDDDLLLVAAGEPRGDASCGPGARMSYSRISVARLPSDRRGGEKRARRARAPAAVAQHEILGDRH